MSIGLYSNWTHLCFDDPTLYLLFYASLLGSPPAGENRRHPQNRGEYADVRRLGHAFRSKEYRCTYSRWVS